MSILWHIKGKNFKTFLLGSWQFLCIKILPYIRALIYYINRKQKKNLHFECYGKRSQSHQLLWATYCTCSHMTIEIHTHLLISAVAALTIRSKPSSKRFIWNRLRVITLLWLQISTIFCLIWNCACEHMELSLWDVFSTSEEALIPGARIRKRGCLAAHLCVLYKLHNSTQWPCEHI